MPTRQEWIDALSRVRFIRVVSSNGLIADIASNQNWRDQKLMSGGRPLPPTKRALSCVQDFNPERRVAVRPIELLHCTGVITTPPIPNLADLSSTWAVLRYLWAFDPMPSGSSPSLVLSREAREIDPHQKTLLSDQIGVGMTGYLMSRFLGMPYVLDVDTALRNKALGVERETAAAPDYLFFDQTFNLAYVVECKGNQTSYASMVTQLRRGTEQVPSIRFTNGRTATSLVVGACMLRRNTTVYVVDPPDDEPDSDHTEDTKEATKGGPRNWQIGDYERLRQELLQLTRAKRLTFAGAVADAVKQLVHAPTDALERYGGQNPRLETVQTDLGTFEGVRGLVPTSDGNTVEVFKGIHSGLRHLFDEQVEEARKRPQKPMGPSGNELTSPGGSHADSERQSEESVFPSDNFKHQFSESAYVTAYSEEQGVATVRSIGRDGTVFQVAIS